jgi:polo-like kinase 1
MIKDKNGHSYEVDIWSIGIIAYALIFGRPPFETNDLKLTYSKIKKCNYSFP